MGDLFEIDVAAKAGRYGVSEKTVGNWEARGATEGMVVPWGDAGKMVGWYEDAFGRNAPKKLKAKCAELVEGESLKGEVGSAVADEAGASDGGRVDVMTLEGFAVLMGLGSTVARVIEEEDRAYEVYMLSQRTQEGVAVARKNWISATEAKRALSKSEDTVELAAAVLKEWVRMEWDVRWREIKNNLGAAVMGAAVRDELDLEVDAVVWDRVWGKELERVLLGVEFQKNRK